MAQFNEAGKVTLRMSELNTDVIEALSKRFLVIIESKNNEILIELYPNELGNNKHHNRYDPG